MHRARVQRDEEGRPVLEFFAENIMTLNGLDGPDYEPLSRLTHNILYNCGRTTLRPILQSILQGICKRYEDPRSKRSKFFIKVIKENEGISEDEDDDHPIYVDEPSSTQQETSSEEPCRHNKGRIGPASRKSETLADSNAATSQEYQHTNSLMSAGMENELRTPSAVSASRLASKRTANIRLAFKSFWTTKDAVSSNQPLSKRTPRSRAHRSGMAPQSVRQAPFSHSMSRGRYYRSRGASRRSTLPTSLARHSTYQPPNSHRAQSHLPTSNETMPWYHSQNATCYPSKPHYNPIHNNYSPSKPYYTNSHDYGKFDGPLDRSTGAFSMTAKRRRTTGYAAEPKHLKEGGHMELDSATPIGSLKDFYF